MKLRSIVVTMVLLAPLFVITPSVSADSEDPPIIGFDFDNGLRIDDDDNSNNQSCEGDDCWISLTGTIGMSQDIIPSLSILLVGAFQTYTSLFLSVSQFILSSNSLDSPGSKGVSANSFK